ncbi:TBC1 domain family member 30-like [Uloborus diversus]|uniref:TBC1 domain family member 30-like n=1 Tax=Uloborus diversus TaxID=327109 RepID=UPI00240A3A9D|nr:TBC1 domain family member 30-like [Uloborus diversus]
MSKFINSALKNLSINPKIPEMPSSKSSESKLAYKSVDVSAKIKYSPESSSFVLWKDAMKMVARLPEGIPAEFRKQLWLTLARKHLETKNIDLKRAFAVCLAEKSDPDDLELGTQIIKDLHRTGCGPLSGDVAEPNRLHLKRVLLAYARWNPGVGYCQGFNMLAAIILEVVGWEEEEALLIMIFLIEEVLPESYFANHLQGLSVDMAVFRDLLRLRLSPLSAHLDKLQARTQDSSTGHIYEPPLPNVFTMQWFLTLFTNCLPKGTVLRVWDLVFLEGNEVLLRAALAIWDGLADRIMAVESADEFYCIMGVLTREILEFGLMDANMFVKTLCTLAPFPFPRLQELRDSYTYNIQPFSAPWGSEAELQIFSGEPEDEEEDSGAARFFFAHELNWYRKKSAVPESDLPANLGSAFNAERMSLDISSLKKQYGKLRERQKQAHIILQGAFQSHFQNARRNSLAVNHLLVGKRPLTRKKSGGPQFVFPERARGRDPAPRQQEEERSDDPEEDDPRRPPFRVEAVLPHGGTIPKRAARPSADSDPGCSCSLSFSCPLHVEAAPQKPPLGNPFPTKRRVGSMRQYNKQ